MSPRTVLLPVLVTVAMSAAPVFAVGPAPPAARATPSITASFESFWEAAHDQPFPEQQALWDRYIEAPREALYRSVVWEVPDNPDWRASKARELKYRFAQYSRIAARIPQTVREIRTALNVESQRFRKLFPGASSHPRVVLVLAPDFDSKSGVLADGTPVLALAVDTLALENADLGILLPHELFHLYDARHAGILNDGVMPHTAITLPLFAEGMAVYVSSVVSPGHTDGEYLFQKSLGALADSLLPHAARAFLAEADVRSIDSAQHDISTAYKQWFEGDVRPLNPGFPNRAGYWLGLHLIRQLRKRYSLGQLAAWGPLRAQAEMRTSLREMARRSNGARAASG